MKFIKETYINILLTVLFASNLCTFHLVTWQIFYIKQLNDLCIHALNRQPYVIYYFLVEIYLQLCLVRK